MANAPPLLRAFIAVRTPPTPDLQRVLATLESMGRVEPGVRPVREENIHITLRFLGGTSPELLPEIERAIEHAAREVTPFEMELHGLGAFPDVRRPRVVWVGTRHDEPLRVIVERMRQPIDDLGFGHDDRPWSSHATLARIKARPPQALFDLLRRHAQTSFGRIRVAHMDLMLSELGRDGPVYKVARSVPLAQVSGE